MKKFLLSLICISLVLLMNAQESIFIKGKTIQGKEAQKDFWVFKDQTDEVIAIKSSEYKEMALKLAKSELQKERLDSIIKAKDRLIAAYENYEEKAAKHILTQDSLIKVADSLFTGYKGLYKDLKSIADLKKFSVTGGLGMFFYDKNAAVPLLDVGIEYNKFQVDYEFGKKFHGLSVHYRLPIF